MLNKRNLIIIIILIIGLLLSGGYYYLNQSYQPLEGNDVYINKERVTEYERYYHFKAEGNNIGLIFYPGGKVAETSYAPLADLLSKNGFNTFIVKMPFNLAIFDKDRADIILNEYGQSINSWYIMGHSLGGAMAASYLAEDNIQKYKGLIFLASYPPDNVDFSNTNLKALSINATNDQVIDRNKLEATRNNLPSGTEFNIRKGGNHAGFGNYGPQEGDGESEISKEEQWNQTVDYIINFIQKVEED